LDIIGILHQWLGNIIYSQYILVFLLQGEIIRDNCITLAEQDCADPKPTAWTKSEVNSIVSANFAKTGGKDVLKYVESRTFPGPVMNGMLVYMADNQAKGSDAAVEFLIKHEDIWTKWVSSGAAKKIKKSL